MPYSGCRALPTSTPPWTPQLFIPSPWEDSSTPQTSQARYYPPRLLHMLGLARNLPYKRLIRSFLSCRASAYAMSIPAKQMRPPLCYYPLYHQCFFSFIALTTASNHNPLMSLLNMFLSLPHSSLSYPPPYPQHLAQARCIGCVIHLFDGKVGEWKISWLSSSAPLPSSGESQSGVPRLGPSTSAGNLLVMQILRPHPRTTEWNSGGWT